MIRLLALVMLSSSVAFAQSSVPVPSSAPEAIPVPAVAPPSKALPPDPSGPSTVIGGEIRSVDPVRDQIALRVFGGSRTMKILYDERTQVYRNGQRISVLDLKPEDHASVETTLDGDNVFALRIHMLSELPQGECDGQVLSYNPRNSEMIVNSALSPQSVRIRVPAGTPVVRVGQPDFTAGQRGIDDLMRGSLVDVKFQPGVNGLGVAARIEVLATPGSTFVFSGDVSYLDVPGGQLVIVDPRDNRSYRFAFNAWQFTVARQLHQGSHVRVTASFDGSRYRADQITIE
ncbi:MAG TPA: hypothetical protein VMD92_13940 [Acidobacteriaceae bacterium]|jgi:hypothetical protein|nr:hypothetical protein [Acidobacteriaceae bacterium]